MVKKRSNFSDMPRNQRSPRRPNDRGQKVQLLAEERALPFLECRVPNPVSQALAVNLIWTGNLPVQVKLICWSLIIYKVTCWSLGNGIWHSVFEKRERPLLGIAL
jgi:hypothetical protein